MGELTLLLVCCEVAQGTEMIPPQPSLSLTVRKPAHRIIISGELVLPFTIGSTQESWSCTSPGQHSTADPGSGYR